MYFFDFIRHTGMSPEKEAALLLGFGGYALFYAWRWAAAKWANWFPALVFSAKALLYTGAAFIFYLFLRAMGLNLFTQLNLFLCAMGATAIPVSQKVWSKLFSGGEKTRRGATVSTVNRINLLTAKALPRSDFKKSLDLSGLNFPRSAEPYHIIVVGSTGSGKSVAITQLLDQIEARGDIALVVDSGGEFSSRYYRPERDAIINPFDDRCAPWSPTAELEGPWDAEALAKSMVPDGTGESKEWNGYAQTFVTSVLRKLSEDCNLSIRSLLYYVQAAPLEELVPFLAGSAAASQLTSDKTFGSIRTIAANYLATYAYLQDNAEPFSVAKYIRAGKPGFLFFTYRDDQLDSLRNMISCALDIAARTILALPASTERRVWLIIDEFASIGKVQSIEAVATKARKMGGCLLLGLQSVSQLKDRYGDNTAQTILGCLSSWLVLRCSDADTSEYISKYIGDAEISRETDGKSYADSGATNSKTQQIQTQRAVMPVELQRLANLQGFFKLAGDYPICEIKLSFPQKRAKISENYAQRDFKRKPMLKLIADVVAPPPAPVIPVEPGPKAIESITITLDAALNASLPQHSQNTGDMFQAPRAEDQIMRHRPEMPRESMGFGVKPAPASPRVGEVSDPRLRLRGGLARKARAVQGIHEGIDGLTNSVVQAKN